MTYKNFDKAINYKGFKLVEAGDRGMCEIWYRLEYMRRWAFWDLCGSVEEAKAAIDAHY